MHFIIAVCILEFVLGVHMGIDMLIFFLDVYGNFRTCKAFLNSVYWKDLDKAIRCTAQFNGVNLPSFKKTFMSS